MAIVFSYLMQNDASVGGRAWLTGVSTYGSDPEDPFPHGYRLNDTGLTC